MNSRRGAGLMHPVALGAVLVLLINDHFAKARWPGLITGKLSDFAGLIFFPLFLQALWELARPPSRRVLQACVVLTAVVFTLVKTWAPAAEVYRFGLGAVQWPFHAMRAVISGEVIPGVRRVMLTTDATDLVALSVVWVSLVLRHGSAQKSPPGHGSQ